ncbi:MAG: DUF2063 domain-containing protein [Azospirillum sp.]|nr:DUF2063 domain-containing protein [Azospirillum sp.]
MRPEAPGRDLLAPEPVQRAVEDGFRRALLLDDRAPLLGLIAEGGVPAARRLAVHRNTFFGFLVETLAAAYPVVSRLVGTAFFRGAGVAYIRAEPPDRPQLSAYGGGFADFLESFAPARGLPYLSDVARLEWARIEAVFAADAEPLDATALQAVAIADYPRLRFCPHPTLRLVSSPWPIQRLWQAHQCEPVEPVELEAGGDLVLVLRPGLVVAAVVLSPGDAALIRAICAGATLEQAAVAAATPGFNLQAALAGHLTRGSFTGFTIA